MQTNKIVDILEAKLQPQQIIIGIQPINLICRVNKKTPYSLTITSLNLYLIQTWMINIKIKLQQIQSLTISGVSEQVVLHSDTLQDVWFQSVSRIPIIKSILHARQKFKYMKQSLLIQIQMIPSLQGSVRKEKGMASKIYNLFKKTQTKQVQSSVSFRGNFNSMIIEATYKNFLFLIAKKIYQKTFKNAQLLYISSEVDFKFDEEKYEIKSQSQHEVLYAGLNQDRILLRKIVKGREDVDQKIRNMLKNYSKLDYQENILFAVQVSTHFEIVTRYLQNLSQLGPRIDQLLIPQSDLRNIASTMFELIGKYQFILYSLAPQHIFIDENNQIKISVVFSSLQKYTTLQYLSPQQLTSLQKNKELQQIKLINLWKVGNLIYEIAFGNCPFRLQYLAYCLKDPKKYKLRFPEKHNRSFQFLDFLTSLLMFDPSKRGYFSQNQTILQKRKHPWFNSH